MNDFTFISYLKINNLFLIKYFSMASGFIHNITLKKKVHTIAHAIYIFFADMCNMKKTVHTVHLNETILLMLMQMFYKNLYFSNVIFLYYASAVIPAIFQPLSKSHLKFIVYFVIISLNPTLFQSLLRIIAIFHFTCGESLIRLQYFK